MCQPYFCRGSHQRKFSFHSQRWYLRVQDLDLDCNTSCPDPPVQGRTQGGCTGCTCIPPSPPFASPPPQPERLVMRKDEAVGNKKKMQVCLPKHNYKLDNNLLTVDPRSVDPHCLDADPDLDLGQPKMCIPPGKILGTPLPLLIKNS
jgi:hypothetical protein